MLNFERHSYDLASDEQCALFKAVWGTQPRYKSPFLSPDFAALIQSVRQDVELITVSDENGIAGLWPLHVGFNESAVGVGGPFSDRNGPLFREGFSVGLSELLSETGVKSFNTEGLVSDELEALVATEELELEPSYITELSTDFEAFKEAQTTAQSPSHIEVRDLNLQCHLVVLVLFLPFPKLGVKTLRKIIVRRVLP